MKIKLHHVALTVKDVKESTRWYKNILGFKAAHTYQNNGMNIVLLQRSNIRLELISFDSDMNPLPDYRSDVITDVHVIGTKHFCIEVDDLDEFSIRLQKKRVHLVTPVDTAAFGGRYIFFKDCNNILIELYQP